MIDEKRLSPGWTSHLNEHTISPSTIKYNEFFFMTFCITTETIWCFFHDKNVFREKRKNKIVISISFSFLLPHDSLHPIRCQKIILSSSFWLHFFLFWRRQKKKNKMRIIILKQFNTKSAYDKLLISLKQLLLSSWLCFYFIFHYFWSALIIHYEFSVYSVLIIFISTCTSFCCFFFIFRNANDKRTKINRYDAFKQIKSSTFTFINFLFCFLFSLFFSI